MGIPADVVMPAVSFDDPTLLLVIPVVLVAILVVEFGTGSQNRRFDDQWSSNSNRRTNATAPRDVHVGTRARRFQPDPRARRSGLIRSLRPALRPVVFRLRSLPTRDTLALATRLTLMLVVALALARPRLDTVIRREAVVFDVDLSASVKSQKQAEEAWIQRALAARRQGDLAGIVVAGREPLAELAVGETPRFTSLQSVPDSNWTNLAASLRLAAAMLPSDARRRVVLMTDGWQNLGDVLQQTRLLRAEGIVVDTVPFAPPTGPEVRIASVSVPSTVGQGERFSLSVRVASTVAEMATLRVFVDGSPAGTKDVALQPGEQEFQLSETALAPGTHRYRVEIDPTTDTIPENNSGQAILRVGGPPRVLVAEGTPGNAQNVAESLSASGVHVTTISATSLPITPDGLSDYDAVVLVDAPARDLGQQRMHALQTYVRDLGRGLLVIGGENSYGLGAYAETPLEDSLPVTMEIPQRKEIPTVAVALIVENLENSVGNDTAKEAAKKVVEQLTPRDEVMVSDAATGFPVPLQHVTDRQAIDKTIDAMQTGDPPSYAPYLAAAANALVGSTAKVKHIILVGDGDAQDNYEPLIRQITTRGITVSAVATAAHEFSDAPTMQAIARWGHGRYYEATDFSVPQALLKEAHTVIRPAMIQDHFIPESVGNSALLTGLTALPALDGYVATTPRPLAGVSLLSDQGDPILASWQYGSGRTIAWTSDANGLWTKEFVTWPEAGQFWAHLVEWVLPPPGNPNWHLTTGQNGPTAEIQVETDQLSNAPSSLNARIVGPDNAITEEVLPSAAPGRYVASFPVGPSGAYSVHITTPAGQSPISLDGELVVPYSPEYRTSGIDRSLLERVAREGGGRVLDDPSQAFADDLPSASGGTPLWRWLLGAAALLLVLDVAVRRLNLSGRDLEPVLSPARHLGAAVSHARRGGPSMRHVTRTQATVRTNTSTPENPLSENPQRVPPTPQEPDSITKDTTLHTARLLAARRKRAGQRERADS